MQAKIKNRLSILAIVLLFSTPVVVAYLMSSGAINYEPDSTKNHGEFISPPVKVENFVESDWVEALADHWTLVYRYKGVCDESCIKLEDELHRYRLSMANRADKLELMLWADDYSMDIDKDPYSHVSKISLAEFPELRTTMDELSKLSYEDGSGLYVIAPEGYLMMAFKKDNTSTHVIQDLKLLLKRKGE